MGALGVAILARESGYESVFDFNIEDIKFETRGISCKFPEKLRAALAEK